MENKSHAMAAGIFVLVLTAMLIGLAFWLTRDTGSYRDYELSTGDTVTGLQLQAPVRFKGVPVGKVTKIGFDPQIPGNVVVQLAVRENTPVTPTTFATLAYQGVTGLAFVQLDDDDLPQPVVPPGEDGIERLPIKPSQLGRLTESAPAILAQVEDAAKRLNDLMSDDNQKRISTALDNIGKAAANVAVLTEKVQGTLTDRVDPALAAMPRTLDQATVTLRSLQGTATDISGAARQIGNTAQRLNAPDGPLDRLAEGTGALSHAVDVIGTTTLPRINRVSEDASRAMRQLSRTVTGINDNPQSLIFGNGDARPGPGEAGFVTPAATAAPTAPAAGARQP
ncbi:MCE family protein [Xylophilus rhododendri]|uniref:MCE family protein n=1 Tax=Xylophilus rhododendri TaxID=2697032 RepID=A0A857J740_9BURK|nr:MlaD family protein [Xylophilus rhododendri]QHI99063.1 MCE family protein [Xylophilus rhododendri]